MAFSLNEKCGHKDCKNCYNIKKYKNSSFCENKNKNKNKTNVIAFVQVYYPEGFSLPLIENGIYYPSSNTSIRVTKRELFTTKIFNKNGLDIRYLNYDGYFNCKKYIENQDKFFLTLSVTALVLDEKIQPSIKITVKRGENGEFPSESVRSFATTISLQKSLKPQSGTATSIINLKPGDTLVPFFEIDTSISQGSVIISDFTFSLYDIYRIVVI